MSTFSCFARLLYYNSPCMSKRLILIFPLFFSFLFPLYAQQPDWENHHVLQINREPARSAFVGYGNSMCDRSMTLNGNWKFHWSPTPDGRIADFFVTNFNDTDWKNFPVPANWEVNGYGTPIYVSSGYPFRIDPPRVTTKLELTQSSLKKV